jgi:hypothetical protein
LTLGRDIDPTRSPIRVPVDGDIAGIIPRLYSAIHDHHVVSSEDQPRAITECSDSQHSACVELSPEYPREIGNLNGVHDSSQGILRDEQSDYDILSPDSAMTLAVYPLLWPDPDLIRKEDSRSDEDSEFKPDPCEARQQGSQGHSGLEDPIVNSTQRLLNRGKNNFRRGENDGLVFGLPTRAVYSEISKLLRGSPPC